MEDSQKTNSSVVYTEDNEGFDNDNIQSFRPEEDSITRTQNSGVRQNGIQLNLMQNRRQSVTVSISDLINDLKSNKIDIYCKDHPDEVLQYYSFTNEHALCSDCLLSGAYTGCEVLNLKKALGRIKSGCEGLLIDLETKTEQLTIWEERLGNKKHDFDRLLEDCKTVISDQMNRLRLAIDRKEKELIESVDSLLNQKGARSKYALAQNARKEIDEVRSALSTRISQLKDIDLSHFYAIKASIIRNVVDEEYNTAIKDLKQASESDILKEQVNLDENQQWISSALESINQLKGLDSKTLRTERSNSLQQHKSRLVVKNQDLSLENLAIPLMGKRSTISEEVKPSSLSRGNSLFRGLSKEIEPISASSMNIATRESYTAESTTDETLKRLFHKIEQVKKTPQSKEPLSSKKDFRSVSIPQVSFTDIHRPRDDPRHLWKNTKEATEDEHRRDLLTTSKTNLTDLEKTKITPKSFIPEYNTSSKRSIAADKFSICRREPQTPTSHLNVSGASNKSATLTSTKNVRLLAQEETSRLSSTNVGWKASASLLRPRPNVTSNSYVNKSFSGSNNLSLNLKRLSREIGLRGTELGL